MSPLLVALFFAVGVSAWVYTKLQRRTGYGNSGAAIKGAAVAGVIAFIVLFTIGLTLL